MEKPKNNNVPKDPLLAQQHLADAASKAREIIELPAHELAERPDHELVQFRGTTENLVGDSKNSVFTKFEDQMLKNREQELLESTDKAGEEFINKLPQGTPQPKLDRKEFIRELYGVKPIEPFDQDAPERHNAA
jgi:hypothetical protein